MAQLRLRFVVRGGKTTTRIGKAKDNLTIDFINEGNQWMTLTFDKDIFLDKKGKPLHRLHVGKRFDWATPPVPPFGGKVSLTVNPTTPLGTETKYTAQIGASVPEDPIIIIER